MNEAAAGALKKQSIIYGVILGIVSLVVGIIQIYVSKSLTSLVSLTVVSVILNFIVFIALTCYFIFQLRKLNGGYWSFSTSLKNIFIMLAISTVISVAGMNLFNTANPLPQEEVINNTMNLTIEMMENSGVDDEQIDSIIAEIEKGKEQLGVFSLGTIVKGVLITLMIYFVLSLILAAIFKKEKPIFINQDTSGNPNPWQGQ